MKDHRHELRGSKTCAIENPALACLLLLSSVPPAPVLPETAVEHKTEHNNCRMRGIGADPHDPNLPQTTENQ
jgi:hypothetical protein